MSAHADFGCAPIFDNQDVNASDYVGLYLNLQKRAHAKKAKFLREQMNKNKDMTD